jgi:hypothetical protein
VKHASAANHATISGFFEKVSKLFRETEILEFSDASARIWNCDETGICTAVYIASSQILARKGSKYIHKTG